MMEKKRNSWKTNGGVRLLSVYVLIVLKRQPYSLVPGNMW